LGSIIYYVTASENGCPSLPSEVTIEFEECGITIPTAFTPDNDMINDTWELSNIDQIFPNNVVSIYNRWGNKLYESDQGQYDQRPWNGTYKDKPLPVASYYFIIDFNDGTTHNSTGVVSILK
jgi:gliding motility-associated-like protein